MAESASRTLAGHASVRPAGRGDYQFTKLNDAGAPKLVQNAARHNILIDLAPDLGSAKDLRLRNLLVELAWS